MGTDNLHFSNKALLITHTHCPLVLMMTFVNMKHIKETRCPWSKFDCYFVFIKFIINHVVKNHARFVDEGT